MARLFFLENLGWTIEERLSNKTLKNKEHVNQYRRSSTTESNAIKIGHKGSESKFIQRNHDNQHTSWQNKISKKNILK